MDLSHCYLLIKNNTFIGTMEVSEYRCIKFAEAFKVVVTCPSTKVLSFKSINVENSFFGRMYLRY